MPVQVGTLVVVLLYLLVLFVIWYVSPRLPGAQEEPQTPFWRSPKVWGSFVALAQIVVYVLFT